MDAEAQVFTPNSRPRRELSPIELKQAATRDKRMAWWHEAKFGMFIHWGLFSIIGQHEWAKDTGRAAPHSARHEISRNTELPSQA